MSKKRPPKLEGFSDGEYNDRPEYNPERVANLDTGLYRHIDDYADNLLVASYCPRMIAEESPSVVYDSETRTISRVLSRYDYNSSPFAADGLPLETRIDIRYQDVLETPGLIRYAIEVKKLQPESLSSSYGFSELYEIEKYRGSNRLLAEVTYVDVVNNTYSSREMTPFDEQNLHDELALMASYVQIEEDRTKTELANDGN